MRIESIVDVFNSTTTPLGVSGVWNGTWSNTEGFAGITVGSKSDAAGTLYVDFSPDGIHSDSTLTFDIDAGVRETHRITISNKYYRVRYLNDGSAQTYFRLQSMLGHPAALNSPLNQPVQQDADAQTVRAVSDETLVAAGLLSGFSITNKFGRNADIDTGSVPEDVCGAGGLYAGFPDSTLETVSVLSTSIADVSSSTGAHSIRIIGLDADYNVQSETISLNGTTPVASVNQYRRVHTASIQSVGSGGVNAGDITIRHTTTTANVFGVMQAGRNQTNESAYTVPAGFTAYMRQLDVSIQQSTAAAAAEGNIWTRAFGAPFRSRRPFLVSNPSRISDYIYGGLIFTEKSDIIIRITSVSNSNTIVTAGYDLILVQNRS